MTTKSQSMNLFVAALALPLLISSACAGTDVRSAPIKGALVAPPPPQTYFVPAKPDASATASSTPTVGVSPTKTASSAPPVGVSPSKITSVTVSSTKLMPGMSFIVKVNGVGVAQNCGTSLVIDRLLPELKSNYANLATAYQSGVWPRQNTFTLTEEGTYQVRLLNSPGSTCGYKGEGSIPGDLTKVVVSPAIAK